MKTSKQIAFLFLFIVFLYRPAVSATSATTVYTDPPSRAFLKTWLLCGSFPIKAATPDAKFVRKKNNRSVIAYDDAIYKVAFDYDYLSDKGGETRIQPFEGLSHSAAGEMYTWKIFETGNDIVDLRRLFNPKDDVVVYAYAEILISETKESMLLLGSDDGLKVWLNGELIHEIFTGRSVSIDKDAVPVTLKKGKNTLLLKIQNMTLDFGFACRFVDIDDYKTLQFQKRNGSTLKYLGNLFGGFLKK